VNINRTDEARAAMAQVLHLRRGSTAKNTALLERNARRVFF
jgi:hypothetical protein